MYIHLCMCVQIIHILTSATYTYTHYKCVYNDGLFYICHSNDSNLLTKAS